MAMMGMTAEPLSAGTAVGDIGHTSDGKPPRIFRILWWIALRLIVAVLCFAVLLAFAQLTVHGLLAYYVNIPPYSAAG
jgi:hypothetical protein